MYHAVILFVIVLWHWIDQFDVSPPLVFVVNETRRFRILLIVGARELLRLLDGTMTHILRRYMHST